jgi:hypothetical protein
VQQTATHVVTAIAAAAVIWWRIAHPNEERTFERKAFFFALSVQFLWNAGCAVYRSL